ncbi:EcsC family protein [Beijerinckia mobilis]|uniref:EcsC family protein n=1 Tax=Beijerinckia mobilis TaxID=231434 RepID=UPI00054E33C5|nr:EcsC family protein [Beijerinckia mobilis]
MSLVNIEPTPNSGLPALGSLLLPEDQAALLRALRQIEHKSFAARIQALVGRKTLLFAPLIPPAVVDSANKAALTAIQSSLRFVLNSLRNKEGQNSRHWHKAVAVLSGATGGAFGLSSLLVELPFSTGVMLHSIADIARSEGEDLDHPDVALACLEVFALGNERDIRTLHADDEVRREAMSFDGRLENIAVKTSYFAMRSILARSVTEATRYLMTHQIVDETAPVLIRLIAQIAPRFGIVVSQKLAAQSVPVLGAVGGAAVNYAFIDHFQTLARGHFTIRRLERAYGVALIREEYQKLLEAEAEAALNSPPKPSFKTSMQNWFHRGA